VVIVPDTLSRLDIDSLKIQDSKEEASTLILDQKTAATVMSN
jgi:hypothetical protein